MRGDVVMRRTRVNIYHVDKQKTSPFSQCIEGLVMLAEFRRMEERKMEEKEA